MGGYRYIQDVTFSLDEIEGWAWTGLKRGDSFIWQAKLSKHGMYRWVAAPDGGIISTEASLVTVACEPPPDGATAYMIFDVEPDRSLHPASWRDYRIEWGERWEDPDNEIAWWKKKPRLVAYRRRVKRAKLHAESYEWIGGQRITLVSGPLEVLSDG